MFVSNVVLYDLKEKGEQTTADGSGVEIPSYADYDISNGLLLEILERDGSLLSVTDSCLNQTDGQGENQWTYSYQGNYLREYDLGGDGFAALHPGLHRRCGGVGHTGSARCPRLTGTLLPQGFGGACKVPRRIPELVLAVSKLLFVGLRHGFSPPDHSLSHFMCCILYFGLIY